MWCETPKRGAKLSLFECMSPPGKPNCPPTKTEGRPFSNVRFVFG